MVLFLHGKQHKQHETLMTIKVNNKHTINIIFGENVKDINS